MPQHQTILYTRQGCHLCDDAHRVLLQHGLSPEVVDIDEHPELLARFDQCVPVVAIDGRERFRGRINEVLLRRLLTGGPLPSGSPAEPLRCPPAASNQLAVFGKFWQAGAVKTRLARAIGAEAAGRLYRQFLVSTLRRFESTADGRHVVYWPATRAAEFAALAGQHWTLCQQCDGDLGNRLSEFFESASSTPDTCVVVIGSDSPNLPRVYVHQAFRQLQIHRVVLGPTEDGGYYLVGARGGAPDIFRGVDWGTGHVWQQTVATLNQQSITFAELPPWYDVDEVGDLQRLARDLASGCGGEPELEQLREAVAAALSR